MKKILFIFLMSSTFILFSQETDTSTVIIHNTKINPDNVTGGNYSNEDIEVSDTDAIDKDWCQHEQEENKNKNRNVWLKIVQGTWHEVMTVDMRGVNWHYFTRILKEHGYTIKWDAPDQLTIGSMLLERDPRSGPNGNKTAQLFEVIAIKPGVLSVQFSVYYVAIVNKKFFKRIGPEEVGRNSALVLSQLSKLESDE